MTTVQSLKQAWVVLGKPNLSKEDIEFVRNTIDNTIISISPEIDYPPTITNSIEDEIAYQQGF